MASEWEELEKLSKEELIIELVRSRYRYRLLKSLVMNLGENGSDGYFDDELLSPTNDGWARRIAEYMIREKGKEVDPFDMNEYGVDDETAERVFEELYREGTLPTPED